MHCLDAANGKPAWLFPADAGGPVIAAPILVGDILFGGTDDGKLFGIDIGNGIVGWEAAMPGNGSIARQPIFAADTLSFTSRGRNPLGPDGKALDFRGNTASFVMGPSRTDLKWRPVASAVNAGAPPLDERVEIRRAACPACLNPTAFPKAKAPPTSDWRGMKSIFTSTRRSPPPI